MPFLWRITGYTRGRAGSGIIGHKVNDKVGEVVGAKMVNDEDQLMLVTDTGRVIRIAAGSISVVAGRASMGVKLMRLDDDERIVDIARIEDPDEEEGDLPEGAEGADEVEAAEGEDLASDEGEE